MALAGCRRLVAALLPFVLLALVPVRTRAELVIEGLDDELAKNVRAYVGLATEPCDAESWVIRRRFRLAESEARTALEPYGYYSPTVQSELVTGDDCWRATLHIDPGLPVRIRKLDLEVTGDARSDPAFARV